MSSTAQYASAPKTAQVAISTANTNRDGTGTIGVVAVASGASGSGTRIDKIAIQAAGTTTAGVVRLYIAKGRMGPAITSITFSGTTATVTTASAHGLTTGHLVTHQGAYPDDYNVTVTACTVTSATTYTYTMGTTPTANATVVGNLSSTTASPTIQLWKEILVTAITPSTTVAAYSNVSSSTTAADQGYLPLILQPGYSLRASTHNAESFNVFATASGDF